MVDYKITKVHKLYEVNNEKCHNYYYLIYGRIYNKEKTKYRKFKFVVWFDIFDLQEYFEKDIIYKEDIKNYVDDLIFSTVYSYLHNMKNYDNEKGLKEFYNYCNETIINYNNII